MNYYDMLFDDEDTPYNTNASGWWESIDSWNTTIINNDYKYWRTQLVLMPNHSWFYYDAMMDHSPYAFIRDTRR
jgi:hypothetical protein